MPKWYFSIDGENGGPVDAAELKSFVASGRLKPFDKVRKEDQSQWHDAIRIKGLFPSTESETTTSSVGSSAAKAKPASPKGNDSASVSAVTSQSDTSDQYKERHSRDAGNSRFSSVWIDLQSLNFWEEVVPVDSSNVRRMLTDPVILAVIGAAITPLLIITLRSDLQLTAFSMLFAFIWGMVFKHYIVRTTVSWSTLVAALFFTGLVGIRAPLLLSQIYAPFAFSSNVVVSLFGFVFGVGACEELCKLVPVLAYLFWKRREADPKTCILVGVFSGLGFAAFENLHFQGVAISDALQHTKDLNQYGLGEIGLREGVREAMVNVLLRSLSLVFCHALWTGVVAYFLTISFLTGRRYAALGVTGILISAIIHGAYDWLIVSIQQQTLAAGVMAGTFILFYAYLLKLEVLTDKLPDGE